MRIYPSFAACSRVAAICAICAIGCGSSSTPNSSPDADADSAVHAYPEISCPVPCRIRWREINSYDVPITDYAMYAYTNGGSDTYLYLVGGGTTDAGGRGYSAFNRRISAAKILENGEIDSWQHAPLPGNLGIGQAIKFAALHGTGEYLFGLAGGLSSAAPDGAPSFTGFAMVLTQAPPPGPGIDGMGSFLTFGDAPMPTPYTIGAVGGLVGDHVLLVVGGQGAEVGGLRTVQGTTQDGTWRPELPLPEGRSYAALAWAKQDDSSDDFFVLGGISEGPRPTLEVLGTALRARVEGGHIAEWVPAGNAPARFSACAFALDNYVYVAGGANMTGTAVDTIERAPILANGLLGIFETIGHLPFRQANANFIRVGRRYYTCGGDSNDENRLLRSSDRCFVGDIAETVEASGGNLPPRDAGLSLDSNG